MKQNCRMKLPKSTWTALARELLTRPDLPTSHQISRTLQIGAPESVKRAYEYLMKAMVQLVGTAEPAWPASKPVPCVEDDLSTKKEISRRRHCTRVYGFERALWNYPYNMVILCSPEYRENCWHLNDSRLAIIRHDGAISLETVVNRYYSDPGRSIIVVNVASRSLKEHLVDIGFLFCHWLGGEGEYWVLNHKNGRIEHVVSRDGEAQRTRNVKVRLMEEQLGLLEKEITASNIWPKDKRTPNKSKRLDIQLDYCATRFMFRRKYGNTGVNRLVEKLVTTAHRILLNDSGQ